MVLAEAGKYPEAEQALERSIEMRPNQYRAWGLLASVYANQHADAAKVRDTYLKAIALAADLLKETPKDESSGRRRRLLRGGGEEKESLPLLAQAAALAPDNPEVLYQVAVGYEMLTIATRRCAGFPKRERRLSFRSDCAKSAAGRAPRRPAVTVRPPAVGDSARKYAKGRSHNVHPVLHTRPELTLPGAVANRAIW